MKKVLILIFAFLFLSCADGFDRNNPYDAKGSDYGNQNFLNDDDGDGIKNYFDKDSKYYRGNNNSEYSNDSSGYNLYSDELFYSINVNETFIIDLQNDPYIDFSMYEIDYEIKSGKDVLDSGVLHDTHFEYYFNVGGIYSISFKLIDYATQNIQTGYVINVSVKDSSLKDYDYPNFDYPNDRPDVAHVNVGDEAGFNYYFSRNNFITASDIQDGDLTESIITNTDADYNKEGHYVIYYIVSDKAGNVTRDSLHIDIDQSSNSSSSANIDENLSIFLQPVVYKLNAPYLVSLGDTVVIPQSLVWTPFENLNIQENNQAINGFSKSDIYCMVYKLSGSNFVMYEENSLDQLNFSFEEGFYKVVYGYNGKYPNQEIYRYFDVKKAAIIDDAEFTNNTTIFNLLSTNPYNVYGLVSSDWYRDNSVGNSDQMTIFDIKSDDGSNTMKTVYMDGNLDVTPVLTVPIVDFDKSVPLDNLKGLSFLISSDVQSSLIVVLNFEKDINNGTDIYMRPLYEIELTKNEKAFYLDISNFENIGYYVQSDYVLKSISFINDVEIPYTINIDNLALLGYDYQEIADILNN